MLLDEDPATVSLPQAALLTRTNYIQLIHHTIGNFNILPDKLAVSRVNESLSTLQQARDLRVREAESALKSEFPALFSSNISNVDNSQNSPEPSPL